MVMRYKVGDSIPSFSLPDSVENSRSLSEFLGQKNVVLFFYPKDFTAVCTLEAKAFRDRYDEFQKLDAEVIGVSSDDADSHRKFCKELDLTFPLLTDNKNKVKDNFIKTNFLTGPFARVTFVIDKRGKLIGQFSSALRAEAHVDFALESLEAHT